MSCFLDVLLEVYFKSENICVCKDDTDKEDTLFVVLREASTQGYEKRIHSS